MSNLENLDVQEIESRLEMSLADLEAGPWICGVHDNKCSPVSNGCTGDVTICPTKK